MHLPFIGDISVRLEPDFKTFLKFCDVIFSVLFSAGLLLMIVHNPELSDRATPVTGLSCLLVSLPFLTIKVLASKPKINLWAFIPMLVILLFTGIQLFGHQLHFLNNLIVIKESESWLSPFAFAFICLSVYFIAKSHQNILGNTAVCVVIISTIGVIVTAFSTGLKSGGWVNPSNYDEIVPILIIGALVSPLKWRWWVSAVSLIGIFFSGAEIGVLCVMAIGLVVCIKRDFSRKLLLPVGALALCLIVATPFGLTQNLWLHETHPLTPGNPNSGYQTTLGDRVNAFVQLYFNHADLKEVDYIISGNRLAGNWNIRHVTLTGHGLEIDRLTESTPHNQFLIMTDQVGIIAACAWVFASFAWAWRTNNWYLFSVIMVIGMIDHFFWTYGILWWWMIVGLDKSGFIYKNDSL